MDGQEASKKIVIFVNGFKVVEDNADPEMTLLYYLRKKLGLTGSKLGCGEGGCGACTVMVSCYDRMTKKIKHYSVNACISLVCSVDGMAITTVEGIGSTAKRIHPVQERIAKAHGSQCGFCTPGIVMSMYTLLRNNPAPSEADIESVFDGNLCRCTGYRPILAGYKTFAKGYGCHGCTDCPSKELNNGIAMNSSTLFDSSKFLPLDVTQEPIFPPELLEENFSPKLLIVKGPLSQWTHDGLTKSYQTTWIRPVSFSQLLEAREAYHNAKIVGGSTEITVEMKVKGCEYPIFISTQCVSELHHIQLRDKGLQIGAACSFTEIAEEMKMLIAKLPAHQTRAFGAVLEMLRWFAGEQIRNVATLGGNIMTASPISDINPILMAVGAELMISSRKGGNRIVRADEKFFVSYRKVAVKPEEVLVSILVPFTVESEYVAAYKVARRREDDIAIVNAGMRVILKENKVFKCDMVFGGRDAVTKRASATETALNGMKWDALLLEKGLENILQDLPINSDVIGGMPEYRQATSMSFFYKFYITVLREIDAKCVPANEMNIADLYVHQLTKASQVFQHVDNSRLLDDPVGQPLAHLSAIKQATGEAVYVDDIPEYKNELYGAVVWSRHASAKVSLVDPGEALSMPGVRAFISAKDLQEPESNAFNIVTVTDEKVFVEDEVTSLGQMIGLVIASDRQTAKRAVKRVKVEYKELPPLLTIQDAIAANSFYEPTRFIKKGDPRDAFAKADHIIEGTVSQGGQEHFYFETYAAIVIPRDGDELEIISSTQNANLTQLTAAKVTGIPSNRIVVKLKRMGGGFGGKETRTVLLTCALALAAKRCGCPVRLMYDRDEDMVSTGTRHPAYTKYKVGCSKKGKLSVVDIDVYINGGATLDLSIAVLERMVSHLANAYSIPNASVRGRACRTNLPSCTAFRGFGAPQGMLVAENIIAKVAETCKLDVNDVRRINLMVDRDTNIYNQLVSPCHLQRCWDELMVKADIEERKKKLDNFNKGSKWKKRSLSIVPTCFGIAFGSSFMNQGGALVHIYSDGNILLTHGGAEMGQGLHTKMIQICARVLGVPTSKVYVSETATNTVANAQPTAASMSTDLYGMAVKDACEQLKGRLTLYMEANLKGSWEDWVKAAYFDRVNLSANGFYKLPNIGYDWTTGEGNLYSYFTCGVACSQVEVDLLTGEFEIARTDILMDVGESINPAIDIGQIEGAFTQGVGLFTLEEHVYLDGNARGQMITTGPGAYKIPGFSDIPKEFNVSLLSGVANQKAVFNSKAIGEPPLFLASSVFFAIREAIRAGRLDHGVDEYFELNSPATVERVRIACSDKILKVAKESVKNNGKSWNILPY